MLAVAAAGLAAGPHLPKDYTELPPNCEDVFILDEASRVNAADSN